MFTKTHIIKQTPVSGSSEIQPASFYAVPISGTENFTLYLTDDQKNVKSAKIVDTAAIDKLTAIEQNLDANHEGSLAKKFEALQQAVNGDGNDGSGLAAKLTALSNTVSGNGDDDANALVKKVKTLEDKVASMADGDSIGNWD